MTSKSPRSNVIKPISKKEILVVKRSWMYKQGDWLHGWQKRLFQLTTDSHLSYFANENDKNPIESINLQHLDRIRISRDFGDGWFLEIFCENKHWILASIEEVDVHYWCHAIQLVSEEFIQTTKDLDEYAASIGLIKDKVVEEIKIDEDEWCIPVVEENIRWPTPPALNSNIPPSTTNKSIENNQQLNNKSFSTVSTVKRKKSWLDSSLEQVNNNIEEISNTNNKLQQQNEQKKDKEMKIEIKEPQSPQQLEEVVLEEEEEKEIELIEPYDSIDSQMISLHHRLIQSKSISRWINYRLESYLHPIVSFVDDLCDGLTIVYLIETITQVPIDGINEHSTELSVRYKNICLALNHLRKFNSKLPKIQPNEILTGKQDIIMKWMRWLLYSYEIERIQYRGLNGKDALLFWISEYSSVLNISNFTTSFQDGIVFCKLLNYYCPNLIDLNEISTTKSVKNIELALDLFSYIWKVPRLIDIEDIVDESDEYSMILYITQLYYHLRRVSKEELEENEKEIRNEAD